MTVERTDTALKLQGMQVLIQAFGEVDAERFIYLINREPFDYTEWRRNNLPDEDVRELSRKAMAYYNSINTD